MFVWYKCHILRIRDMKKISYILVFIIGLFNLSSCTNWLEQDDLMGMSSEDAYSSDAGITSIASNFYSRMKYWQDFSTEEFPYDMSRWDESSDNSQYWSKAGNVDANYRSYYDYTLVRELNLHIKNLETISKGKVSERNYQYYLSEARFLRAFVYFRMVTQNGGVPLITEPQEYTDDPITLAKPRNKESEIYDFIIDEMDASLAGFSNASSKTRATKDAALALKCRAALYAGTLAYNFDKSAEKALNLASGATGIDKNLAVDYLKKCLDAVAELETMGYSLYKKDADYAKNYADAFVATLETNPEIIFCKAYDGVNVQNDFTMWNIPRSQAVADKSGAQVNPVLNLVNDYELVATHAKEDLDAYVGEEVVESMSSMSSTQKYIVYDKIDDIFAGRDPRLAGTVLYPGSSFRNKSVDLQAGLAIPTADGYEFKSAKTITEVATANYNGVKLTGTDGPLCDGDGNWYISHTGFLLRKYVDKRAGSEINGASQVPYIIFRYGEMLLNGAEAAFYLEQLGVQSYNGKGMKDLALYYINQIRNRAAGAVFEINASELTFDRIMNERRVELAFEDHRYYDLKRWRLADELWHYDVESPTAGIYVLWPYKIYAPGTENDGKWIYRKMKAMHRANNATISFDNTMYYNLYPMDDGNPYIEKNPNH